MIDEVGIGQLGEPESSLAERAQSVKLLVCSV